VTARMESTRRAAATLVLGLLLAAPAPLSGCNDETHDEQVAALGGEDPNVPPGPDHRPGQPCLTCHGGIGPAKEQFSIGGTVYAVEGQSAPAVGATVQIEDITGALGTAQSNEAGNFYITVQDWSPTYPILPQVTLGSTTEQMTTHVGRTGSCGDCHSNPASPTSAGPVYMMAGAADASGGS
jgi:hypothetical protein